MSDGRHFNIVRTPPKVRVITTGRRALEYPDWLQSNNETIMLKLGHKLEV